MFIVYSNLIKMCSESVFALELACLSDSQIAKQHQEFHLLRRCQRSTKQIVECAQVGNLNECKELARNRKGLAINYSWEPQAVNLFALQVEEENGTTFPRKTNRKDILDQPEEFFNCLVFDCPETLNMTAMVNDSRFDYYSLYTNPPRR